MNLDAPIMTIFNTIEGIYKALYMPIMILYLNVQYDEVPFAHFTE